MELMEYSLTTLLYESQDVPMYVKLSILKDVSRGVHYLHTLNPPVIHFDLNSNNILFTSNLMVRIKVTDEDRIFPSLNHSIFVM